MTSLRDRIWRRRLEPAGGWLRVALSLGLVWATWRHDAGWMAACALGILASPFLFPPPKRLDNAMSRALLGERVWLEDAGTGKWLLPAGAVLLGGGTLLAAWQRHLPATLACAAAAAGAKACFLAWTSRFPARDPDRTEKVLGKLLADASGT